jgi:hypothetical protein
LVKRLLSNSIAFSCADILSTCIITSLSDILDIFILESPSDWADATARPKVIPATAKTAWIVLYTSFSLFVSGLDIWSECENSSHNNGFEWREKKVTGRPTNATGARRTDEAEGGSHPTGQLFVRPVHSVTSHQLTRAAR